MNGCTCPRCGSPDLTLARVLHEAGTAVSIHETAGFAQTAQAGRCAPPGQPKAVQAVVLFIAVPFGLWGLYLIIPMRWGGDVVDLGLVAVAGYLMFMRGVLAFQHLRAAADYPQRLEAYERTAVCGRCGQRVLLPGDWDSSPS